jgi:hypothetical protein
MKIVLCQWQIAKERAVSIEGDLLSTLRWRHKGDVESVTKESVAKTFLAEAF